MGLIDELKESKVFIDTALFIYYIEKHEKYLNTVKPIFTAIDTGSINAITSTITLLEVLVHPFRLNNETLAEKYREILLFTDALTTFEISNDISETAAKLRAKYSLKTPDAIQIAVGITYGAGKFLTNDPGLKKVSEIKVISLDEYLV